MSDIIGYIVLGSAGFLLLWFWLDRRRAERARKIAEEEMLRQERQRQFDALQQTVTNKVIDAKQKASAYRNHLDRHPDLGLQNSFTLADELTIRSDWTQVGQDLRDTLDSFTGGGGESGGGGASSSWDDTSASSVSSSSDSVGSSDSGSSSTD